MSSGKPDWVVMSRRAWRYAAQSVFCCGESGTSASVVQSDSASKDPRLVSASVSISALVLRSTHRMVALSHDAKYLGLALFADF